MRFCFAFGGGEVPVDAAVGAGLSCFKTFFHFVLFQAPISFHSSIGDDTNADQTCTVSCVKEKIPKVPPLPQASQTAMQNLIPYGPYIRGCQGLNVTNSSAAVGWMAMVALKSRMVSPAATATANPCSISSAASP